MLCNGLNYLTWQLIDATAGGLLSTKYPEDVDQLIENMASHESHWSTLRRPQKAAGMYEVTNNVALATKIDALTRKGISSVWV